MSRPFEWVALAVLIGYTVGGIFPLQHLVASVAARIRRARGMERFRTLRQQMDTIEALLKDHDLWNEGYDRMHLLRYASTLTNLQETIAPAELRDARILAVGEQGAIPLLLRQLLGAQRVDANSTGDNARDLTLQSKTSGETVHLAIADVNVEAETWPYADATYDLIVCFEMLEHLERDPAFFALEAHRVLKEGGRLVLTTPNASSFKSLMAIVRGEDPLLFSLYGYGTISHAHEYSRAQLHALFTTSGFTVERYTTMAAYEHFAHDEQDPQNAWLLHELVTRYGMQGDSLGNTHFIVVQKAGRPTMRMTYPVYGPEFNAPFTGYPVKQRIR